MNCQNGGSCISGVCSCAAGYTGVHCDDVTGPGGENNPTASEVSSDDGRVSDNLKKIFLKTTSMEKF